LLVVSAVGTTTVYADDGTTGSTETGTTTTDTNQGDTSTNGDVEQPAGDSSTVGEIQQPPDDTTTPPDGEQPTGDTSTVGEVQQPADGTVTSDPQPEVEAPPILEQLPENTTVTVVDEAGEAQPLASQESAEAVLISDPIWCPATQTVPTPGENGCTASYSSFTELLDFLQVNESDVLINSPAPSMYNKAHTSVVRRASISIRTPSPISTNTI